MTAVFLSAFRSPSVSSQNQIVGGSDTSTPPFTNATARGICRPARNSVRLSMRPSLSVSSSTAMVPTLASSPVPSTLGMYARISTTHMRPSASNCMATGSRTSGSAATSSMRKPGASLKVSSACAGVRAGAAGTSKFFQTSGCFWPPRSPRWACAIRAKASTIINTLLKREKLLMGVKVVARSVTDKARLDCESFALCAGWPPRFHGGPMRSIKLTLLAAVALPTFFTGCFTTQDGKS